MSTASSAPERRYVSPLLVSRALGVSETTVKRWVDEGRLPAHRTEGGHRRILASDVVTYASQRNWPTVNLQLLLGDAAAAAGPVDVPALGQRFYDALSSEDPEQARALLLHAHQNGMTAARLGDEVISPAMARLGHCWAAGEVDVWQEHRGTQVCLAALLALKARLDEANPQAPGQPLALGGGPEFDHYLLANLVVEMTLREEGWRVVNVGPNTPFASFRRALVERKPDLLWLSCSYLADAEAFLAGYRGLYEAAQQQGVAVTVGGRALTDPVRERMTFTHHGDRMAHLVPFARQVHAARRR